MESLLFCCLLLLLVPLLAIRAMAGAWDAKQGSALGSRWRSFLFHGLDDLRKACWPGIRYERATDIWFHVVLIEFFAVLDATARPKSCPSGPKRILIVKLAHFGDALHVFPMMRELRRQNPDARIDLLVGPWCEALAKTYALHDRLILQTPRLGVFERGDRVKRRNWLDEFQWLMELRRDSYDLVVSTSTTSLSELLLMHVLRARRWVGTHLPSELYAPIGDAILIPYDSRRYESDRVMDLLELLGARGGDSDLFYPLSPEATNAAEKGLQEAGIPENTPYVVLAPGAGWPGKQWLPERFGEIGNRLFREHGYSVVVAGTAGEGNLCAEVARHLKGPVAQLAGRTTLDQLAAILSRAALFIGNDSGPMHLAACFRIPSVVLFGPTVVSKWAPRHSAVRCLQHGDCSDCISWHFRASCLHQNRCMKAISVEEAWAAVQSVLATRREGKAMR